MSAPNADGAGIGADEAFRLLFPNAGLLPRLERLRVAAGGSMRGTLAGKRRSVSLGGSLEFADYRPYAPGDDIRRIDWNVYGRTGKAYMRQYWDEQELHVHLYVDASRSMLPYGERGASKLRYAMQLAASVGYIALCGDDRVSLRLFDASGVSGDPGMLHGRSAAGKLFRHMAASLLAREGEADAANGGPGGSASAALQTAEDGRAAALRPAHALSAAPAPAILDLSAPFRQPGSLPRRAGVSWLFTDALYESGIEQALVALMAAGQRVVLVQVLSPEELDPALEGELRLIDSELGTGKEVAVSPKLLGDYRAAVADFQMDLKRICGDKGAAYAALDTGLSMDDAVTRLLLAPGALQS